MITGRGIQAVILTPDENQGLPFLNVPAPNPSDQLCVYLVTFIAVSFPFLNITRLKFYMFKILFSLTFGALSFPVL